MLFQPPLKVVASGPAPGRYASVSGLSVWLEFSASVPSGKAEKGIVLKENGTTLEVRYSWSGRRVVLTPVQGFSLGNRYDLSAASTIEDDHGLDLGKEFALTFYTRPDDVRPTATVTVPAYGASTTEKYQPVTLQFSRAADRASFYANLSFSPSFKAAYTWGAGDTSCVVTPLEELKSPQVYTVKLGSALADTNGNTLGTDLTSWFAEGTVTAGPSVAAVVKTASGIADASYALTPASSGSLSVDSGFERTWGLELRFDRPVARSGLDSLITIEPAWGFSIPYPQTFMQNIDLVPTKSLAYGTTYTLTVRKGVADSAGNLSTADQVYRFRVDGPGSAPPRLQSILFNTNLPSPTSDLILGDHSTDYTALDAGAFGSPGTATYLILAFQVALGASLDTSSLMQHFSVTATDANTSVAVTAMGTPVIDPTHQSVRVDVLFTRGGSGLLLFKLTAGLGDSVRNATAADEAWPVLE
jgi:hypothetical protein